MAFCEDVGRDGSDIFDFLGAGRLWAGLEEPEGSGGGSDDTAACVSSGDRHKGHFFASGESIGTWTTSLCRAMSVGTTGRRKYHLHDFLSGISVSLFDLDQLLDSPHTRRFFI